MKPTAVRHTARVLLAGLLLPMTLLLSMPGMAQAATTFGPVVHMVLSNANVGFGVQCEADAYWARLTAQTAEIRVKSGYCDQGGIQDLFGNLNESDRWIEITFKGTNASLAGTCSASTGRLDAPNSGRFLFQGAAALSFPGPGETWAGCVVNEVCSTVHIGVYGPGDVHAEDICEPVELGEPPDFDGASPVAGCPHMQPTRAWLEGSTIDTRWWTMRAKIGGQSLLGVQWAIAPVLYGGLPSQPDQIRATWPFNQNDRYLFLDWPGGGPAGADSPPASMNVDSLSTGHAGSGKNGILGEFWVDNPTIKGIQIYPQNLLPGNSTSPVGAQGYQTGTLYDENAVSGVSNPLGMIGRTIPSKCIFYFGEKVADVTATTEDEPAGPLGTPVGSTTEPVPPTPPAAPTGGSCDFDVLSPSTWLEGGMCAAVGLLGGIFNVLKEIVTAIAALPGKIMGALAGILESLFVPSDGFLDDAMADLRDAWNDTAPSKWATSMGSLVPGSMTGCEGIPLDVTLAEGVEIHEHLGAACSGQMATAASLTRTVVSAMVVVGGGLACIRALGSGLGWNPNIGRGAGT